jgi:Ser/Thr protein kinase RdoA (MazF antagonist)
METSERLLEVCRQFVSIASSAGVVPIAGGFSGASVWRIEDGDRTYALRRWPAIGAEPARLHGLHRLLKLVWSQGLDEVAVPLPSASGQSLIRVQGELWQLEPWMPGIANFHADPNSERMEVTMCRLARWHAAARLFVPLEPERPWFESRMAQPVGLSERLLKLTEWQSGPSDTIGRCLTQSVRHYSTQSASTMDLLLEIYAWVQRIVQPVTETLKPLMVQPVWQHPCLRDIWHDHLLFSGNRLTGLIDPGACRTDHFTADLSRMLGSLLEDDRTAWNKALDIYQTFQPLTLHDWNLLAAYDQSGVILSGVTWLQWLIIGGRTFQDPNVIEARLKIILRRLKTLGLTR